MANRYVTRMMSSQGRFCLYAECAVARAPKETWGPPKTQGAPKSQYLTLGGFLYIIHSIPNNCLAALIADSYLFQHN